MEKAAKSCLWAALGALAFGVVAQAATTPITNWMFGDWLLDWEAVPGWYYVASAVTWMLATFPLMLSAALVAAAIIINTLGPRIGQVVQGHQWGQARETGEVSASTGSAHGRPDAATFAERSLYEPNA
ncbi:hypothetical protein [Demequina globuliformis]|uniref:hypothetical protein n=1 Tax=Demequina globuliformis TaxID=676202 RepID=UPI000783EA25|nr:hypothetical protein [Demequina globuliformis]